MAPYILGTGTKYGWYTSANTAASCCYCDEGTSGYINIKLIKSCKTNYDLGWISYGTDTSTCGDDDYRDVTYWWRWYDREYISYPVPKPTPQERLKEILQQRHAPRIIVTRNPLQVPQDQREVKARETLRLCLGEEKFKSFLKNGFVTVRARSGLVYQIFPGHGITAVYKNGQMVERLCVILQGNFPPADSLIMRFLLILNDEEEFRRHAIKHGVHQSVRHVATPDTRSLPEIYRQLKAVA